MAQLHKVSKIILHCSATEQGRALTVADIDKWHRDNGWASCGYHFVVHLDGEIAQGRRTQSTGAHCAGQNDTSLGVCYIGGLADGKPSDTRTPAQRDALCQIVFMLLTAYSLPPTAVHVHNEYANKACPCFSRQQFLQEFQEWLGRKGL